MTEPERFLLDDFDRGDGVSAIGTRWQGFTDRVMGGLSDMQAEVVETDQGKALRMTGRVRLENNGGFIQVRLPLAGDRETFDASSYTGIETTLRGRPGAWFLHLRTPECSRPWQYYRAPLPVSPEWSTGTVDFDAFEGKSIAGRPDPSHLRSIAVAAYGEAFDARIEIARVALVRSASG
ncbi:MAG: NADH ubiquinone oxidoreductase [Xanthomonadales bacterium]|nr:NADH ubiquinone oxidoreductase [Xanthomonadales bacterium]